MPPKMKDLGIDRWSIKERADLAHEILDSIAQEAGESELSDEVKQEIDRRLAAHAANPTAAIAWEDVEAETLARLGQ